MTDDSDTELNDLAENTAEATEKIADAKETVKKTTDEVKKLSTAFAGLGASNVAVIRAFADLGKETISVAGQFGNIISAITETVGTLEGWKKVLDTIDDSLLSNSQKLATALDTTRANYVKASGDIAGSTNTMGAAMNQASIEMTKFGVDTAVAGNAVRTTIPQIAEAYNIAAGSVGGLSAAQKNNLADTIKLTATFEGVGISAAQSTSNMNLFADSMGISRARSAESGEQMGKTVMALTDLNGSFTESAALIQKNNDIALIFGGKALVELQGQATATGIALDSLAGVSAKFNTFEGAAEQVGKLNALLGADYLGVTDMMYAEPAEQVKMITNAFRDARASVEDMDPIQKKFMLTTIQSTLGLKDQQEALRFLNADEFEQGRIMAKNAEEAQRSADIQKNLNDILQQAMPTLEQLTNAFSKLMSGLAPLFEILNSIIREIAVLIQYVADLSKKWPYLTLGIELVILVVTALISLFISLGIALLTFVTGTGAAAIGATALAGGLTALAGGTAGLAATGAAFSAGMLAAAEGLAIAAVAAGAFGGAILLVGIGTVLAGAGLLLAAHGIVLIVDALSKLTGAQGLGVIIFFGALTGLLYLLIPTAAAAAIPLMSVGFAMLQMGAAIAIAAAGIGLLIYSFTALYSLMQGPQTASAETIIALSTAIDKLEGKDLVINVIVTGDLDKLNAITGLTVTAASAPAVSAPAVSAPAANSTTNGSQPILAQPDTVKIEIKNMVVKVGEKEFRTTIDSIVGDYISSSDGRTKILSFAVSKG